MRKLIPFLLFAISLFAQNLELPTNKAIASTPAPLSAEKKLELYTQRDKVDPALSKVQALPVWAEYQAALADQRKANAAVDAATNKIKGTEEGKNYIKAADEYATAISEVMKTVDQTKWKLGPGYEWVAVPKAEPVKSTQEKK
jgi:hypothetical protein